MKIYNTVHDKQQRETTIIYFLVSHFETRLSNNELGRKLSAASFRNEKKKTKIKKVIEDKNKD